VRVIECNICGETLSGDTDEELVARLREHTETEHRSARFDEARAKEMVSDEAYDASDS
jgi:predicted small metal-binding protein